MVAVVVLVFRCVLLLKKTRTNESVVLRALNDVGRPQLGSRFCGRGFPRLVFGRRQFVLLRKISIGQKSCFFSLRSLFYFRAPQKGKATFAALAFTGAT